MKVKNPVLQAAVLIGMAMVIAIVANGFAARERRLVLPGYYPNALRVPPRVPESVPPPPRVEPHVPVTTATIVPTETVATTTTTTTPATTTTSEPKPAAPQETKPAPGVDPLAKFTPHPNQPYVEIGGADAQLLHAKGVLFLDARRTSVFEEGHIAGARSFSVWESDIDDKVNALFNERSDPVEQDKAIVIYCSGGACEDSHMLAEKLYMVGFDNVLIYRDGFPDWEKRGLAVSKGTNP